MKTNTKTNSKKKTAWLFAAFCLAGVIIGVLVGIFAFHAEGFDFTAMKEIIRNLIIYVAPVLLILVFAFVFIYSLTGYIKSKKAIAAWDGEDEDYIEKVEAKLDVIISILTIGLILVYSIFAVCFYGSFRLATDEEYFRLVPLNAATYILFIVTIFYNTFIQRACVELVKKINPEKKGDTLSVNFSKEWEQSMDEAQQLMLYEAGYRTYKVMNMVLLIVWLICTMGILFGMGLLPSLIVSALWLTSTITYSIYGYKIEHKSKKR